MFINLVNTIIPFEEYQLTQDKIDALKFRLLLSEGYLNAYELDEKEDPFENYHVFLLLSNGKILFLIVGNASVIADGYPLLRIVDMSSDMPRQLYDKEMIAFLSDIYKQYPDKPITGGYVSINNELDAKIIIHKLDDELDFAQAEKEKLKQIILKKVYNYDYQPCLVK